jgi:Ca2+-binding RTX toxin-like protein
MNTYSNASTDTTPRMGRVQTPTPRRASQRSRRQRAVILCTLSAGLAAVLAPAAQAATSVVENPALGTLTVTAEAGKVNQITVNRPNQFVVHDQDDIVSAGNGCTAIDATTVTCASAGIATVSVLSGDRDDRILYNAAALAVRLSGGDGNDVIRLGASAAASTLIGDAGNDTLQGGPANDTLDGGDGADTMSGGAGPDLVTYRARTTPVTATIDNIANDGAAGEGDNIVADIEDIFGGSANDVLTGSAADNRLFGAQGNDTLNGLTGNDLLAPGAGDNSLSGGDGDDSAVYEQTSVGRDVFSGGAGRDVASYKAHTGPVNVSLDGIADDGVTGERDNNLSDVEDIIGTTANDTLSGNIASNTLFGLAGSDTLNTTDGIPGNDTANGGTGLDRCLTDIGDARIGCEL